MIGKRYFDLHQFDGTGGAGGGNGGDASHESGETEVLYGKQAEADVQETDSTDEGHDADGDDEEQKRKTEFERLVKGDYKDLYDEAVKDNINRRFKGVRESKEQVEKMNMALLPLYEKYGIDAGDVDGLEYAIRSDMTLYAEEADAMGMTPEQYAYAKQAEIDAMKANEELEKIKGNQEAREAYQGWLVQGEELKKTYPAFDLATEVQGERFMNLLQSNWSVADAYEAVHAKELITRGIGTAAEKVQKNVVDNIRARGMRPAENGTGNKPGVIIKKDPSQFDEKDLEEIRRRVANGEKIVF